MNSFVHILEVITLLLFCGLVFQVYRCNQNFYKVKSEAKVISSKRSISIQVNIPSKFSNKLPTDYLESDEPIVVEKSSHKKSANNSKLNKSQASKAQAAGDDVFKGDVLAEEHAIETNNDRILNEYIGEFFGGLGLSESPNIAPFKDATKEVSSEQSISEKSASKDLRGLNPVESLFDDEQNADRESSLVQSSIEELSETMTQLSSLENQAIQSTGSSRRGEPVEIPVLTYVAQDSDEVIIVESESINNAFVEAAIVGSEKFESLNAAARNHIPVLTDIASDNDDETIIVVSSNEHGAVENDKVMSDKVVHAMLDEAKLVCAS